MKLAQTVFDNTEKAKRWMATPNLILGATPLDLLGTDEGAKRVEDELTRIEHGDFA
ncbi:MbcA/ParS/Xre antitoxin family protein [Thermomonas fusca]